MGELFANGIYDGPRLMIVTGKGGVGKSTIAMTLASTLALKGLKVLFVRDEIEAQSGVHGEADWFHEINRRCLTLSNMGDREPGKTTATSRIKGLARGRKHREEEMQARAGIEMITINPMSGMEEHFVQGLRIPQFLFDTLFKRPTISSLFNAIPGIREIFIVGKIWFEAFDRKVHDVVIWDAPPSGQVMFYLATPRLIANALKIGPIAKACRIICEDFKDPERTGVVLTTIPEELAINEANELLNDLERENLAPLFRVVLNKSLSAFASVSKELSQMNAGLQGRAPTLTAALRQELFTKLSFINDRFRSAEVQRARLQLSLSAGATCLDVPLLFAEGDIVLPLRLMEYIA